LKVKDEAMLISVVIPAFDEEAYLGPTLASLNAARALLLEREGVPTEIVVVDNDSTDSTDQVASEFGAGVVRESVHNIARVRNKGAASAAGDVLVFVDADTTVPAELLWRVFDAMSEPKCLGGAVDTDYRPSKLASKI
jgi:glycosyltransferase involved in cell wall biosynthesis